MIRIIKTTSAAILLLFIFSISSCSFLDNDSPQVVFVEIPSVSVLTEPDQGAPTHKFTEVWVNANGQQLGVFPLPALIPVIIDDVSEVELTVFPGFRNNGVTETPFIYTLMAAEKFDIPVNVGETTTINPVFKYSDNAKFDFVESFEVSNIFSFKGISNTTGGCMSTTDETAKSGQRSGKIEVTDDIPVIEVGTVFAFDGANNGRSDSYIELDYKCDIPFFVGIYKTENTIITPVYEVVIAEQEDWNKIYIDVSLILVNPGVTEYRAAILASKTNLEQEVGTVFVDNVKLVHF